jgi:anti-sigma regulatory factor (Ser/Thr protein kinase)
MYEGEINTVIHGKGGEAEVTISSDDICITFRDQGPGIPDIEKAMQAGFSTASNEARELGFGAGMGFPNMKKYTDEMRIDTVVGQGTTITMKVKF